MQGSLHKTVIQTGCICALTLALLWPALWTGAPLAYFDTQSYHNGGGVAVAYFLSKSGLSELFGTGLGGVPDATGAGGGAPAVSNDQVAKVRSVPFSINVSLTMRVLGLYGAVIVASVVTAWLIWLALSPLAVLWRLLAGLALCGVTTVAFYASYIMPDIHAAWLILIPIIVVQRRGRIGAGMAVILGALACAAILFHYSHIPLAAAMGGALGLWLLVAGRWGAAVAVQVPLVLALAGNIAISAVLPGKVSLAPARFPILLARSLADGVAVRYLSENCDTAGFTICELYDTFPATVAEALWRSGNIRERATAAQMGRIADEEVALIWQVFLFDPEGQIRALLGNAADQFTRIGLYEVRGADYARAGPLSLDVTITREIRRDFAWIARVEKIVLPLAALLLLLVVVRVPGARLPVALLVLGLAANALVCGGLSAPADRYQGRIAWLVLLVALAQCRYLGRNAFGYAPG